MTPDNFNTYLNPNIQTMYIKNYQYNFSCEKFIYR